MTTPLTKLLDLAGFALAHGVWCVSDGEDLTPLVMASGGRVGSDPILERFSSERLEEGVARGKEALANNEHDAERQVLVFDGFLNTGTQRIASLVVEGRVKGVVERVLVLQPYNPGTLETGFAVFRPKLELPEGDWDTTEVGSALFSGIERHERGGKIWNRCLVDPT